MEKGNEAAIDLGVCPTYHRRHDQVGAPALVINTHDSHELKAHVSSQALQPNSVMPRAILERVELVKCLNTRKC